MRIAVRAAAGVALVVAALGCPGGVADHEVLGDRAYVDGAYGDALAEYRLALRQHAPNGRLRAKAAAAALRVGDLRAATEEYAALAREAAERLPEAADGLERVARAALADNDRRAVALALESLQQLAPTRALGTFAGELAAALGESPQPSEALAVLPYAAAAAPDARALDSLMYGYAVVLVRAGRCEAALPVFEALLRRGRAPAVLSEAQRRAAACALGLGRRALDASAPARAETWFLRVVGVAGDTRVGRAAYVGLGDVMFARGDFGGAVEAYQRAMTGVPLGDSIAVLARERLNRIGDAGTVIR